MGDSLEHPGAWDCYTRLLPCLHCTPPIESIISLNRPPGHVDDYVGALPCLHTHSLALSHLACIICIVGVKEGVIAQFLAFVPDNDFKSVCQLKWVYSITQPHSNVHRNHPHPHHTPLVNGLQHLYAKN